MLAYILSIGIIAFLLINISDFFSLRNRKRLYRFCFFGGIALLFMITGFCDIAFTRFGLLYETIIIAGSVINTDKITHIAFFIGVCSVLFSLHCSTG